MKNYTLDPKISLEIPNCNSRLIFNLIDRFSTNGNYDLCTKEDIYLMIIKDPHLFLDNFDILKNFLTPNTIHPLYIDDEDEDENLIFILCKNTSPFFYWKFMDREKMSNVTGPHWEVKSKNLHSENPILRKIKNIVKNLEISSEKA